MGSGKLSSIKRDGSTSHSLNLLLSSALRPQGQHPGFREIFIAGIFPEIRISSFSMTLAMVLRERHVLAACLFEETFEDQCDYLIFTCLSSFIILQHDSLVSAAC